MSDHNHPTKKQRETLDFISDFIEKQGYSPSFREIQRALGVKSVSTVASHVDNLIAKGYLRKSESGVRSLEITTPGASRPSWQTELIDWGARETTTAEAKQLVEKLRRFF